ncbi:AbrB/MazE/SpoVT family DNA-binding domain-containing protein [Sandarakinorhabdus sp.]|jgi:AbrB family looped-hinge helix DNA binding protein|uniref:AbrB/MazE/SpoVT family DNA-binding domain-containing protein n=1 Tax=Sandarakinorhabdus sp. TaxID=1916663 RepID=UPI003341871C
MMNTVTVSPKFQIVIPKEIRNRLSIEPGQKLTAMVWDGQLTFVPQLSLADLRGICAGMENDFVRDRSDLDKDVY